MAGVREARGSGAEGVNPPPALYQKGGILKMVDLEEIRAGLRDELQPSQRERGKFICPLCGSGTGSHKSAAFSIEKDGKHGKCFSCGFYGDRFDLVAQRDGITLAEATRRLIEQYSPGSARARSSAAEDFSSYRPPEPPAAAVPSRDFPGEVAQAHGALSGSEGERYLMGRGFTAETMERFKLGYVPSHFFPGRGSFPAILFPYDPGGHYVGWRALTEKHYDKPKTSEAGEEPVFNAGALYSGGPVFVVESQLCAISIEQEGGRAVAIGGSGEKKLLRQIEKKAPGGLLILSLDNDEPGQEAQQKIAAALEAKGIPFIEANVSSNAKDPNELLQQGGGLLRQSIASTLRTVNEAREKAVEDQRAKRQQESAEGYISGFMQELRESMSAPAIPTGFPALDRLLDGGLYPGLYILGAITSLGKTTFTLQLCDQIAAAGHDVLFYSLEMARQELTAKSISRITYELTRKKGLSQDKAKTTRGIMASKRWASYGRDEMELMAAAIEDYKARISGHVWQYEGVGNIGIQEIRQEVERHIAITGRLPVLAIDYLQILAPVDMRASDKQNTDKNVLELKRLSRDKGIPIIGISSLNRDNYTSPINNAAFKESGAIEYSSDVLIGLQFSGMDYQEGETDKARDKRIRELVRGQKAKGNAGQAEELQLKILKNRNGRSGTDCLFSYRPMFNHYEEALEGFTEVEPDDNPFSQPKKKRPL